MSIILANRSNKCSGSLTIFLFINNTHQSFTWRPLSVIKHYNTNSAYYFLGHTSTLNLDHEDKNPGPKKEKEKEEEEEERASNFLAFSKPSRWHSH